MVCGLGLDSGILGRRGALSLRLSLRSTPCSREHALGHHRMGRDGGIHCHLGLGSQRLGGGVGRGRAGWAHGGGRGAVRLGLLRRRRLCGLAALGRGLRASLVPKARGRRCAGAGELEGQRRCRGCFGVRRRRAAGRQHRDQGRQGVTACRQRFPRRPSMCVHSRAMYHAPGPSIASGAGVVASSCVLFRGGVVWTAVRSFRTSRRLSHIRCAFGAA
mmetsp:Transcript_16534/g.46980  ORF Transcript_16534/g.46980 Transcript_16534/m.46980 type:complete len:217 (-) Transcript_16534:155-805(-)